MARSTKAVSVTIPAPTPSNEDIAAADMLQSVTSTPIYSREEVINWATLAIKYEENSAKCKKLVMLMLVGEFGEHAVRPYDGGKGGINCGSFKANSSLETMQFEAGRLDMPLGKAQELAGIIAEIRAMGERSWQEFQRVMFGRTSLVVSSVPITSIAGEALANALDEKKTTSVVKKIAKAQLELAKVTGKDTVEAQAKFDNAAKDDLIAKENAEFARHAAKVEADKKNAAKATDSLSDAIQIAIDLAATQGRNVLADKLTAILLLV